MNEWIKSWAAPGLVVVLLAQGVTTTMWFDTIKHSTQVNAKEIERLDRRVNLLEQRSGDVSTRLAVLETQISGMVSILERIEKRLESNGVR